ESYMDAQCYANTDLIRFAVIYPASFMERGFLRHDVIRTLFPYHLTGMLLPELTPGFYRVGLPFSHQCLQTQLNYGDSRKTGN
ncbi:MULTISPECIES: hypothetical protein, partial [Buttiauxella]